MIAPEVLLLPTLNHLLAQSGWALGKLQPYAGNTLALIAGPWRLRLEVSEAGHFQAATRTEDVVQITLPANTPLLLLTERERIFGDATLQGPAEFTEVLGQIFRHLDWDAESDLSKLTGDILARRLVQGIRHLFSLQQAAVRNLGGNLSEFLRHETVALVPHDCGVDLANESTRLGPWVESLESRIRALETSERKRR